jgi:Ca2+-binding EF-hand superfamily protein
MDMHASFHHFDRDRSGSLEKHEVEQALQHSGVPNARAHASCVAIISFTAPVCVSPSCCGFHPKRKWRWRVRGAQWLKGRARAGFHLDQHAFAASFGAFDPDRTGSMSTAEFVALAVFCRLTAAMYQAFDPQRMGRATLDYNQFVYAAANCK